MKAKLTLRCVKMIKVHLTLTLDSEVSEVTYADPEGGEAGGSDPHPEKSQKYRVSSNTLPDPLKNHKSLKPAFNVGPLLARQLR